ncbi:MAG: Putative transposase, YhgA [Clostridium sp. Maddingley MBC34-26]|nr:Rpn family recombination-promoting nuclease/putative transposase [Clostridium sp. LS]EKQ58022.1 MAG: Putative transposase, YhgA [Clostridium sp. Maddingley MBC34-26]
MPLRLLFYINEILREHIKNLNNEKKKNKKGFNIPAVIPIVLYNATKKWNAPIYFKDIVKSNELFGENIINFKYELFDINHKYTKEELIKNRNITSAIFLLDQKVEPLEFLDRLKTIALEFNKLTNREKEILKHWLRNTVDETIRENVVKILEANKEGVENMVANNAFMIEEMKQKVKKETEKDARKQERIEIVKNAIKLGMNDEDISKLTGLNVEEISKIRTKN